MAPGERSNLDLVMHVTAPDDMLQEMEVPSHEEHTAPVRFGSEETRVTDDLAVGGGLAMEGAFFLSQIDASPGRLRDAFRPALQRSPRTRVIRTSGTGQDGC